MEKPRIFLGSSGKQAKLVHDWTAVDTAANPTPDAGQASPRDNVVYWRGERSLDPDAPQLEGTAAIRLESEDRATGYFITRVDALEVSARTVGEKPVKLIADSLKQLKAIEHA